VCDLLGNCTMVGPFSFKIDKQKPTISGTVVPGTSTSAVDGSGNTWWNGPVSLQLNANDGAGGSGVASISYSSTGALVTSGSVNAASTTVGVNPAGDGATTFGYSATDVAGNPSANGATTIYIDRSGPVPTCTAADSAWHATDQSVNCTVADAGVGLMNASDASFSLSTSVSAGSQSANALTASRNVCDKLNNCTVVGPFAFKIDKTNPTASITTPVNNATYSTGQVVNASYACADTGSGIAAVNGCVGTVANGTPIDTSAGTHQFNVTAKDVVGNTYSTSVTYTVTTPYQVCPQYDTTTPKPRTGTVVIKLWLCDATGNNLSSSSLTLTAKYIDNVGQPPSPDFQGGSNYGYAFRFDTQSSTYIYNLDPTSPSQLGAGKHTLYFVVNGAASPLYSTSFMLK